VLTQYVLLYIVREILERDNLSGEVLLRPENFVRDIENRKRFKKIVGSIVSDIISDLNEELREVGPDFDYRDKLRDSKWINDTRKALVATHSKLIARGFIKPFSDEWKESYTNGKTEMAGAGKPHG
jgi:hypothetical protein